MPKNKVISLRRQDVAFIVVAVFLLGIIIGLSMIPRNEQPKKEINYESSVKIGIPAVDSQGKGVVATLYTTVKPGTGKILVNVDNILSQIDTQFSSRTAAKAAAAYMNVDLQSIDVIFNIRVNATIIEGPSAGSSMATSVVLALSNITPEKNIMMTGTIEENGTVGDVGAITEKALAARDSGAGIFIVPPGQSENTQSKKSRTCDDAGTMKICHIDYVKEKKNISSLLNITVIEAKNLGEIIDIYRGKKTS